MSIIIERTIIPTQFLIIGLDYFMFTLNLRVMAVLSLALVLSACGTTKRYGSIAHPKRVQVERVAFNSSDIVQGPGTTMLVGRAYLGDQFQERVANFVDVVLNPVSRASDQWYQEVCQRGKVLTGKLDPAYSKRRYLAKTNNFGQFAFSQVPKGEYYLTTRLYWLDTKPSSGPVEYGGLLAKRVKLDAATHTIDLNQQSRCPGYFH